MKGNFVIYKLIALALVISGNEIPNLIFDQLFISEIRSVTTHIDTANKLRKLKNNITILKGTLGNKQTYLLQ